MLKLGIIRETKNPPDRRVPLTPAQCRSLLESHPGLDITVQPSPIRCFGDDEYRAEGIRLDEDMADRDVLIGVKEVKLEALLPDKTYFFFSHTAKEQPYNRGLLQEVIKKRIRLVDYEYLTLDGVRVVAFGRWAGLVGAYNGLRGWGLKTCKHELKPANECFDLAELLSELEKVDTGKVRITVTGGGRVAGGALEILDAAGILPDVVLRIRRELTGDELDPGVAAPGSEGVSSLEPRVSQQNAPAPKLGIGHRLRDRLTQMVQLIMPEEEVVDDDRVADAVHRQRRHGVPPDGRKRDELVQELLLGLALDNGELPGVNDQRLRTAH